MPWFYDCMDSTGLHERTARKGSLHARAALPSTYSAEAIVKLNTAVPGSPGTTSGTQGGALGGRWTAPTARGRGAEIPGGGKGLTPPPHSKRYYYS